MRVTVELEDREAELIRLRAETLGATPSEVVTEAVRAQRARSAQRVSHAREVAAMVRQSWCDADIALYLGLSNNTVASIRRTLGLPPNRRDAPGTAPSVAYGVRS
ncbi:hypothetical protein [Microbacterium halotolerans]|uniref:hypothetical protein n=1 Tax=Microbacterium halotolerans TaxID=246613 RepID=UPI0013C36165|nr:hypothetical protein [Microbacterium halotolerans]